MTNTQLYSNRSWYKTAKTEFAYIAVYDWDNHKHWLPNTSFFMNINDTNMEELNRQSQSMLAGIKEAKRHKIQEAYRWLNTGLSCCLPSMEFVT